MENRGFDIPRSNERAGVGGFIRARWIGGALAVAMLMTIASTATAARLCVLPLGLPFEADDDRFELVESKVSGRFEAAGFEIVPAARVAPVVERVEEEFGAVYDPYEGRVIAEAIDRYRSALTQALRNDFGCTGRLQISIIVVEAGFSQGTAEWDGVIQRVSSGGRTALQFLVGVHEFGWMPATSLRVDLMDVEGDTVGFRSAGIEVLGRLSGVSNQDKLPLDRWLRDEEHFMSALDLALGEAAIEMRDAGDPEGEIDGARVGWPESR